MKGLFLKDLYMAKKYLRSFLILMAVFVAISCLEESNMFFVFYPCILCGMIPVNLLGYDERSGWDAFAGTLPCTRAQLVSVKYLIGLVSHGIVVVIIAVIQGIRMAVSGSFPWSGYLAMLCMLVMLGCISAGISLPFMFKFGVEKGRMAYYVMVGIISGCSVILPGYFRSELAQEVSMNGVLAAAMLIVVALYALSWWLSIRFYEKRELK